MRLLVATVFWMLTCTAAMQAASKPHVIVFGKAASVKLFMASNETQPATIEVRPLFVDGKLKEFTTGPVHDITQQQFTVQRVYRVNDSLPADERKLPKWEWQRGGWLLVDRPAGRISPLRLPDFDAYYSDVSWYRDYAAYCGLSDTGDKLYAMVVQVGLHKPLVRSFLQAITGAEPMSVCSHPVWQRGPARATFELKDGRRLTFSVHGRAVDVPPTSTPAKDDEPD